MDLQQFVAFLLELVTVSCATCGAIDGQSMDILNLVLGGGAAIGAAAAGANVDRDAWTWGAATPGSHIDRRLHDEGTQHEHWGVGGTVNRDVWRGGPTPTILDAVHDAVRRQARRNQKWAESIVGKDQSGTVPGGGGPGGGNIQGRGPMEYDEKSGTWG